MTFHYTARAIFDKSYNGDGISWQKYIEWSKLTHLTELISRDCMLNELLVEVDRDDETYWNHCVTEEHYETGFFKSDDYVLKHINTPERFNFLAVIIEPTEDCINVPLKDFNFIGYDLLDKSYDISALTNCGGFDETFLPVDLNELGLVEDYEKAFDIKKRLFENNPEEYHSDTNMIAVYRHNTIGR